MSTKVERSKPVSVSKQLSNEQRNLLARMLLLGLTALLIGQIVVSWIALNGFEQDLEPELYQKAHAVGIAISSQLSYAVNDLGIPANELVGIEDFFDSVLAANDDIEFLGLVIPPDQVLQVRGAPLSVLENILTALKQQEAESLQFQMEIDGYLEGIFPIRSGGQDSAFLHVGVRNEHVRKQLSTIFYEIITVIAVSLLVTLEFLMFFTRAQISGPMGRIEKVLERGTQGEFSSKLNLGSRSELGIMVASMNRMLKNLEQHYSDQLFELRELINAQFDKRIARKIDALRTGLEKRYRFTSAVGVHSHSPTLIRVPLFLFIFSEELSRSFLPLFAAQFIPVDTTLSHDMLAGLPISLFMVATFVATFFAGGLTNKLGSARVFSLGIGCALIGYIGTFFSQTYGDFVAWRCLSGVGYGLIFIASEAWVALRADKKRRAQSSAAFVGAVFVGIVCGPPIGGMFADRIGYEATFLISAVLALTSGLFAYYLLRDTRETASIQQRRLTLRFHEWKELLSDIQFLSVFLAAIPTKMTMSAFIYFLVPLYLHDLSFDSSSVGRMIMLYGIIAIVGNPIASRLADRSGKHDLVVASGSLIACAGLMAVLIQGAIGGAANAVLIAIVACGLGHSLMFSSQNAIAQQVAHRHRETIGVAAVLGVYRLFERTGMVIGPIIAALLANKFGFSGAIVGIALIVLVTIILFELMNILSHRIYGRSETA